MSKKILIITSSIDMTVDYIINKYSNECDFYRFNVDTLENYKISINPNGWEIIYKTWEISNDIIDSIYYRKPRLPDLTDYVNPYVEMIQSDIINLVEGLANSFEGLVLSKPYILHYAENKVLQMQLAKKANLLLPDSFIGNDVISANNVVNEEAIIKPLVNGKHVCNDEVFIFQTEKIDLIKEDINLTPIYVQKYCVKDFEARVTFVGIRAYCVKIQSSNKVDWRDNDAQNVYTLIDVPNDIYDNCISLLRLLDLQFGAFDFIIQNGQWIFLEVNPNGQWLWLEEELDLDISKTIVNFLNKEI